MRPCSRAGPLSRPALCDQNAIAHTARRRQSLVARAGEQALKSGQVGAVLAWLPPRLRAECLRRLQLAALYHDGLAFVVREAAVADRPNASPLRLALRAGGVDRIRIDVVKRRGPPLLAPLLIDLPSALSAAAKRRSRVASTAAEVADKAISTF